MAVKCTAKAPFLMEAIIKQFNAEKSKTFSVHIEPDDLKIDIEEEESILIECNNINHLSACGGTGKCSTCRIEVTDGLQNCHPRNDVEAQLAKNIFPKNIRLGCKLK